MQKTQKREKKQKKYNVIQKPHSHFTIFAVTKMPAARSLSVISLKCWAYFTGKTYYKCRAQNTGY